MSSVYVSDILNEANLQQMIDEKYINVRQHPSHQNYQILDYSRKTQFDKMWNNETTTCRGLIIDTSNNSVVSRAFPKFFNHDEPQAPKPPVGVMIKSPKMDGSLGILYVDPSGRFNISTRGSFASEQALHATEILHDTYFKLYPGLVTELKNIYASGSTALFEIIYPENRIVCDYGSMDVLVLLDVVDNKTGDSRLDLFDSLDWPDKAKKTIVGSGYRDTIASDIPDDEEGYVLYWPHTGLRLKAKGSTYVMLHAVLTNTSSRVLWSYMAVNACKQYVDKPSSWANVLGINPDKAQSIVASGDTWMDVFIDNVPDEFYSWVEDTMITLECGVLGYVDSVLGTSRRAEEACGTDGRLLYEYTKDMEDGATILQYVKTKDYGKLICRAWKSQYPTVAELPFKKEIVE